MDTFSSKAAQLAEFPSQSIRATCPLDPIAYHPRGLSRRALLRVQSYIAEHLAEPFTPGDLALLAGVTRFHFARLFRFSTGVSPMQFVRTQRLQMSKELLIRGELTIAEIASEIGFCDQSHYCRSFRRMTGMTPSAFAHASYTTEFAAPSPSAGSSGESRTGPLGVTVT